MKKRKKRKAFGAVVFTAIDGPYADRDLLLSPPGDTAVFRVGTHHGYYRGDRFVQHGPYGIQPRDLPIWDDQCITKWIPIGDTP